MDELNEFGFTQDENIHIEDRTFAGIIQTIKDEFKELIQNMNKNYISKVKDYINEQILIYNSMEIDDLRQKLINQIYKFLLTILGRSRDHIINSNASIIAGNGTLLL